MGDTTEKRRTRRYTCGGNAKIDKPGSHAGQVAVIRDLSLGGCLIDVPKAEEFKQGSPIELTINSRGSTFRVRGIVTKRTEQTLIGVAFQTMTARSQEELKELIELLMGEPVAKAAEYLTAGAL